MNKSKVGRKEILTLELAKRICDMVEAMPDASIQVTWANVSAHAKRRFGHGFNRQMLSQKEWEGRKLIAEAFSEARVVQRRMQRDQAPKYKSGSRTILQKRISELEVKVLALKEELEKTRAHQFDELDVFRSMKKDLVRMIEKTSQAQS